MEFIRHKDAKQVINCLSVAVAYLVEHTLTITEVVVRIQAELRCKTSK